MLNIPTLFGTKFLQSITRNLCDYSIASVGSFLASQLLKYLHYTY